MRPIFVVIHVIFMIYRLFSGAECQKIEYGLPEIKETIERHNAYDATNICDFEYKIKNDLCNLVIDLMAPNNYLRPLTLEHVQNSSVTPQRFLENPFDCISMSISDSDTTIEAESQRSSIDVPVFYCRDVRIKNVMNTNMSERNCVPGFYLAGSPSSTILYGFCKQGKLRNGVPSKLGLPFLIRNINLSYFKNEDEALKAKLFKEAQEIHRQQYLEESMGKITTKEPYQRSIESYTSNPLRANSMPSSSYDTNRRGKQKNRNPSYLNYRQFEDSDDDANCSGCIWKK